MDTVSLASWVLMVLVLVPILTVLFRPTVLELILVLVVDALVLTPLFVACDSRLFIMMFPNVRPFFSKDWAQRLEKVPAESKQQVLDALMSFPLRRALYSGLLSFVYKAPVVAFLVSHYWASAGTDPFVAFRALALFALVYVYFGVLVYFESFPLIKDVLAHIARQPSWAGVLSSRQTSQVDASRTIAMENVGLTVVVVMIVCVQTFYAFTYDAAAHGPLWVQVFALGVGGAVIVAWTVFSSRHYVYNGLYEIFAGFDHVDPKQSDALSPIDVSPLLNRFRGAFVALQGRLAASERELSALVFKEADRFRLQSLGEVSALVSHDLAAPLNVIQFCAETAQENPEKFDQRYRDHLLSCANHCVDMVASLRAYLKNPREMTSACTFREAHDHVLRLLSFQVSQVQIERVKLVDSSGSSLVSLKIPRSDLIHVLMNLYGNALDAGEAQSFESVDVVITMSPAHRGKVIVKISDNGTGLSRDRFEALTAFSFLAASQSDQSGLGLRLTRRVVEQRGGSLEVVTPDGQKGTVFELTLILDEGEGQVRKTRNDVNAERVGT